MSFLCLNCSKISESLWDLDDEVEVFGSLMGGATEEEEVENVMLLCKKEVGGGADFAKGLCFREKQRLRSSRSLLLIAFFFLCALQRVERGEGVWDFGVAEAVNNVETIEGKYHLQSTT